MENTQDELESLKYRAYGSLLLLGVGLLAIVLIWSLHSGDTAKLGWVLIIWSLAAWYLTGRLSWVWANSAPTAAMGWVGTFLLLVALVAGGAGLGFIRGILLWPLANLNMAFWDHSIALCLWAVVAVVGALCFALGHHLAIPRR